MKKPLKYLLVILTVVVPCILTILIYNDKITQNSPVYFKQGVNFFYEGDYQNAYYNFGKIKRISPLYPMAIYRQAQSAQKVGDYKTAAIKYKLFLEKLPDSIFDTNAKTNLGKCYYYSKQYESAKVQFEELKEKNINKGSDVVFYLGLTQKNLDKKEAAKNFREYIQAVINKEAENTEYLQAAADELSNLCKEPDENDRKLLGIAYYKSNKYKEALEYFSKLPIENCWDYLVLSNHYAGNKVIAKKLIENGITKYSKIISEENLYKIYDAYTSYMKGTKLKNRQNMLKLARTHNLSGQDYVIYMLADIMPKEKAIVLYEEIVQKYPDGKFAPEALWMVFWDKYKKKEYKTAEEIAQKHIKSYNKAKSAPKILYWLAKTELKLNKTQEAHSYFNRLASKYPDNYYGLRSQYIIDKRNDFFVTSTQNKIPIEKEQIAFPIAASQIDIKDLKLINTVFDLGDKQIWLEADFKNNSIAESWFELKKGNKSKSIVLARDAIDEMEIKPPFSSPSYQLAYPRYYVEEINLAGKKLGLDPYIILALIREESYFNESAKSKTNASGLMQIMPETANYMISKLSVNVNDLTDLENPRMNMYLGCNYLKYLKDRFNDDLMVIAAYNGGEGSVNKWSRIYNTSDYDEFIEDIPFEETRHYIKKVFRSYHLYKIIYK